MRLLHHLSMNKDDEKPAMDFWGRVELFQIQRGVNLKAVCVEAGIHYQTTLNQKSNAQLPSLKNACLLAKVLGCSVEWLFFGEQGDSSLNDCNQLAQQLYKDKRLFAISRKLTIMTQEELFSLEVLLKIRN